VAPGYERGIMVKPLALRHGALEPVPWANADSCSRRLRPEGARLAIIWGGDLDWTLLSRANMPSTSVNWS